MPANTYGTNGARDFIGTSDFLLKVGRGEVPGAKPFSAFGKAVAGGTVATPTLLWPNGAWAVPPALGITAEVVSSSASDTATTGTGIWTLEVHYLDGNLNEEFGTATLNGLTAVPVINSTTGLPVTDLRFVQCMHLVTYGTGKAAAGNITLRETGQTQAYSYISAGSKRCSSSARMVPAGKEAYIAGAYAGSVSATADAQAIIQLGATVFDTHDYTADAIIMPFASVPIQSNSVPYTFPVSIPYPAGSVIAMDYTIDKAGTVSGGWFGWVESV